MWGRETANPPKYERDERRCTRGGALLSEAKMCEDAGAATAGARVRRWASGERPHTTPRTTGRERRAGRAGISAWG